MPPGVQEAQVRGDAAAIDLEEPQGQRASPRGVARDLRVEPAQLGPLRDGGAAPTLPAARLDDEEVGQRAVELARVLSGELDVLHLAVLGQAPPPPPQVLAELAVELRLDLLVLVGQGKVRRAQRAP